MLKVGLTGGIGSGKSTASKFFEKLGAFILDADKEAKNLLEKNEIVQHEVISEFGTDIINTTGKVDKNKLARVAFQDVDHQRRLNSVVHPYIYDLIDKTFDKMFPPTVSTAPSHKPLSRGLGSFSKSALFLAFLPLSFF